MSWVAAAPAAPVAAAAVQRGATEYFDDEAQRQADRQWAVVMLAYDPLFGSLRGRGHDWRAEIAGDQLGFHFIDRRAATDSFLFMLEPAMPEAPGREPDEQAARRLCRAELDAATWTKAEVRLLALCIARFGAPAPAELDRLLTAARGAIASYPRKGEESSPDPAKDKILLFRAAALAGQSRTAAPLLVEAANDLVAANQRRAACERARCAPDVGYVLNLYVQASANLLLGYLESPTEPVWHEPAVQEALTGSAAMLVRRLSGFAGKTVDEFMLGKCELLDLPYGECRATYFAGPLLPPAIVETVANFVAGEQDPAERCARLRARLAALRPETDFRPGLSAAAERFASHQCPQLPTGGRIGQETD